MAKKQGWANGRAHVNQCNLSQMLHAMHVVLLKPSKIPLLMSSFLFFDSGFHTM